MLLGFGILFREWRHALRLGRQKPLKILTVVCTRLKNCADFLSNGRMSVNKAQPNKPSRLLVYGF